VLRSCSDVRDWVVLQEGSLITTNTGYVCWFGEV
jgi:hypothetical protein